MQTLLTIPPYLSWVGTAKFSASEELLIDQITDRKDPTTSPMAGMLANIWMSSVRRALGETQEGGGTVGECFLAAARSRTRNGT